MKEMKEDKNMDNEIKTILEFKKKLEESGIDTENLVYMPVVPLLGFPREFVVEEWFGIKVAKLISWPVEGKIVEEE